jgi:transposase
MLDRLNRHDLSDEEWERLRVFLPADPPRGGRWSDHRMVINGIFFRAQGGLPVAGPARGLRELEDSL